MNIDKQEIRRYLGYGKKTADEKTEALIESCITKLKQNLRPLEIHRTFDFSVEMSSVVIYADNLILKGKSIKNHLSESKRCVLMAATLGPVIDQLIRYISRTDLTQAIVMDAVATTAIEAFCDEIESSIRQKAKLEGFYATHRFSPGYGDLPLSVQHSLLRTLDTPRKIGLSTTENMILIPRKSVTAVIGLQERPDKIKGHNCKDCNPGLSCPFKKEETQIEHS